MEIKLEHFLHDLVWLIKEEYNDILEGAAAAKTDLEKASREGQGLAYHRVLELIDSQLTAFGDTSELFKSIAPEFGEKAEFRKAEF